MARIGQLPDVRGGVLAASLPPSFQTIPAEASMYSSLACEVQKVILEERLAIPRTRPPGATKRKPAMSRARGCRWALRGILLAALRRRCTRLGVAVVLVVGASVAAAAPALAASSTFGY